MPTKPTIPADLPAKVLECIRLYTDPQVRISREHLSAYCRASDRQVRDAIAELRNQGYPIVSNSGAPGYYYDPGKVDEIIADMESRIQKMARTVRAMRRGRNEAVRQLEVFG